MVKEEDLKEKASKYRKIVETIANMEIGETISPTALFKPAKINPNNTGRDLLDFYQTLKKIGFDIRRDKNNKIKHILKTDEDLDIKKELRDQRREIIGMRDSLDEIKTNLKNKR